jgi:hypothetical protein
MPRSHRVRPSFFRAAQIVALACGLLPALTFAQQPLPYGDAERYPEPTGVAQPWTDTIPAHLAIVDGNVWLERDGDVERAEENVALLAGDRVRTADGRAEVLFADGSALDIDRGTTVALLSDTLIGLERGRMRLALARAARVLDYRIDGAGASAFIRSAGEYRLAVLNAESADVELRLTVIRGSAELASPHGRTLLQTGYEAVTTAATLPSHPYAVSVAINDAFERWAYDRRAERLGVTSAQYLPEPIHAYSGVLDHYGSWAYERPYGYVWFPRVASGWRPYHDGRWSFSASFGWIWVGGSRWSWPTHHYGRWGAVSGRWFWIPNRHWGPAWVSWVRAPGYIGWCPLGFDNRPVISVTNITVFNSRGWNGWTVLPSRHFVRNVVVRQYAVTSPTVIPATTRFAALRAPEQPAGVRFAAARRPLGSPTVVSSTSGSGARPAATGRAVAVQGASPARTAASRPTPAVGPGSAPIADSNRTGARAPAARSARPATAAPIVRSGAETAPARTAAPRRAAPGTAAISASDAADRQVTVTPGRASRSVGRSDAAGGGSEVSPPVERAAPRRAAPTGRPSSVPEPPASAPRRAAPANDTGADRPDSVWAPPASRGGAGRRAAPVERAAPVAAPEDRGPAAAPGWRSRGRPESAPAASAPAPPPSRTVRPAAPASAPADTGGSRSRAGSRPAPESAPSESSAPRRRAGSRQ